MATLAPPTITVDDYDDGNEFHFDVMSTSTTRLFRWTLWVFCNVGDATPTTDQWSCRCQFWTTTNGWVDMWQLPRREYTVTSPGADTDKTTKIGNWQSLLQALADIIEPIQLKLN